MKTKLFVLSIAALCLSAAPAMADLTPVYQTSYGSSSSYGPEEDLAPGLPEFPGNPGGDEPANGVDDYVTTDVLSSNYKSWVRIDDDFDQFWMDINGGLTVTAKYTSSNLTLGYSANEHTGSPWVSLGLTTVGQTASINLADGDCFIWGISGKWSNEALNAGNADYFVTYRITELLGGATPGQPTYVFGFEDGTDYDYQDFVWEATNIVPVPAAVLLGFLGLSAAGIKLRKFA